MRFKVHGGDDWWYGTLHSRSGKSTGTGKWKHSWNIQFSDDSVGSFDFVKDISDWHLVQQEALTSDSENLVASTFIAELDKGVDEAKVRELNSWKDKSVYTEVEDHGQPCISVRWVLTPKIIDGVPSTKARLVAKGFQEVKSFRTDSPTCSRESIRLLLALTAAKRWKLQSIDIHAAFLQGSEIDRTVFLRPPVEANTTKIWKLQKCVYGLSDAPRQFYLRLREELSTLGVMQSSGDPGLYYWTRSNTLEGILVCHVDDMLWSGTKQFHEEVIELLRQALSFGTEQSVAFRYIGIEIQQHDDFSISVNQNNFARSLTKLAIPVGVDKHAPLSDSQRKNMRSKLGQLNWLANVSRPEISFDVCFLSSKQKESTLVDLQAVNKIISRVQSIDSSLTFPVLDEESLKITVYADASFNSLPKGGSQGAQLVLLTDKYRNCSPIGWNSSRLRRVVRSALGAETLAFCDGCELAFYIADNTSALQHKEQKVKVDAITDSRSLFEALGSTKQPSNHRLRVEINALRDMVDEGDISVRLVKGARQISDPLTKRGASDKLLLDVLQRGHLPA